MKVHTFRRAGDVHAVATGPTVGEGLFARSTKGEADVAVTDATPEADATKIAGLLAIAACEAELRAYLAASQQGGSR